MMLFCCCQNNLSWRSGHCGKARFLPAVVSTANEIWMCRSLSICQHLQSHPILTSALPPSRPEEPSTWSGYMGKMFMAATNYLPAQVSDMMNQDRAFATGRLNFSGQRNICTLSTYVQGHPRATSTCACNCIFPKHKISQTGEKMTGKMASERWEELHKDPGGQDAACCTRGQLQLLAGTDFFIVSVWFEHGVLCGSWKLL